MQTNTACQIKLAFSGLVQDEHTSLHLFADNNEKMGVLAVLDDIQEFNDIDAVVSVVDQHFDKRIAELK